MRWGMAKQKETYKQTNKTTQREVRGGWGRENGR